MVTSNVMRQDSYVLAIDMGSSSVKAILVSSLGELAGAGLESVDTMLLPGGGAEHDPEQWWRAVMAAAKSALAVAAVPPDRIRALVCTTQWAVTLPVDAGGHAIANALSWMDTRGGRYSRAASDGWPKVEGYSVSKLWQWVRLTGAAPNHSGVDGFGHILFFKNERPDVYARADKFLEPMDYLNLRLTGRCAASYSTIFPYWLTDNRDPNRIDYHPSLLRAAGIDRSKMPDLLPVNAVLGELTPEVAAELGLAPGTRVVMGSGDSHSATIGAGCVRDYDGYFCIGTTAWLSCHVPSKKTDVAHSIATMPAALPGRYIVSAEQGTAGRCLEFLKNNILFPVNGHAEGLPSQDLYAILNAEAAQVEPGSDGLIFTPWINGVLAPREDHYTRSAFFNQSARTTRAHYARAVMEGVAFNLRWLKGHVEKFIGRPFAQLNFIGGGATSDVWCQIQADILGCPVRRIAHARNANAAGAALAAFSALGDLRVEDISAIVKVAETYEPEEKHRRIYDQQFREFLEFYRRMRPIYKRLNPVVHPV
jgi:xylulokinase